MNLNYLQTYIEVIKLGGIGKAARNLYLSQPAVSFQIQKLERELGFRLIDREKNNFSVTREGKRFFRFAEYVFQEHKHLLYDLRQMNQQGVTGNLLIVANSVVGEFLLPPILTDFKELNPSIEIRLAIDDSYRVIERVENGTSMIGFGAMMLEKQTLKYTKIGEDEVVLIVYPGHPLSSQKEVTVSDLLGESIILRFEPVGMRPTFSNALIKAGFDLAQYQPKLILNTTTGVITAVQAKSGVAFVSYNAIKNIEAIGLVKVVKIKNLSIKRDLFCMYRKEDANNSLLMNFVEFTTSSFLSKTK